MADIKNRDNTTKEYATDELGMMADAKEYAKRDFEVCKLVVAKMLDVETLSKEDEAKMAQNLIQVKYEQIKNARINRVSYFD
jgi:hypothetical protein